MNAIIWKRIHYELGLYRFREVKIIKFVTHDSENEEEKINLITIRSVNKKKTKTESEDEPEGENEKIYRNIFIWTQNNECEVYHYQCLEST